MPIYRHCHCKGIAARFVAELGRTFEIRTVDGQDIRGVLTQVKDLGPLDKPESHTWPAHGPNHQRAELTVGGQTIVTDEIMDLWETDDDRVVPIRVTPYGVVF